MPNKYISNVVDETRKCTVKKGLQTTSNEISHAGTLIKPEEAAMKDTSALHEIDRVVDQTIKDKSRAAKLKSVLHQQYELTRPGNSGKVNATSEFCEEGDDFWDNVPV